MLQVKLISLLKRRLIVEVWQKRIKKIFFHESADAPIGNVPKSCCSLLLLGWPLSVLETSAQKSGPKPMETGGRSAGCRAGICGCGKEKAASTNCLQEADDLSFSRRAALSTVWCFFTLWRVTVSTSPASVPFVHQVNVHSSTKMSFLFLKTDFNTLTGLQKTHAEML